MTEYDTTPGIDVPEPVEENAAEPKTENRRASDAAWSDVMASMDQLGKSVGAWAGSVQDDARGRERARQLKSGLERVGKQLGEVFESATKSGFVQEMGTAAIKTGDVVIDSARRVGDEVAPHVAGAFISAAQGLLSAAERLTARAAESVTEMAEEGEEKTPARPAPPVPPMPSTHAAEATAAPYTGAEPPAPAESGVHETTEEF